jgi:hypothetical protein
MLTGETASLRALAENCSGCQAYADLYEETYARGGMYEGSTWEVTKQLVYPAGGQFYSFADVGVEPGVYREDADADVERFSSRSYTIRVALDRRNGAWVITGLRDAS